MAYAPKQMHSPIDDAVNIPSAVRAAAARSEQLVATQGAPEAPTNPATEVAPIPIEPEVTAPAATTPTPTPATAPAAPTPAAPTPAAQQFSAEEFETMRQRAMAAEGRAKAEAQSNNNLRQLLAATSMQTPVVPATPPQDMTGLITKADEEAYGTDFLDTVKRAARESLGQEIADIRQQLGSVNQKFSGLGQITQDQARANMFANMDNRLPEWRQLNEDKKFLEWLQLTDPFSGATRMQLLSNAVQQADANRALAFFQSYIAEAGIAAAPASAETRREVPPVSLSTLAAPGRAPAHTPSQGGGDKPIISRAQISKFYADVASGKYAGRDKERTATENAIFAAQRENRIRS
ncbi:hypothetical protein [Methylocystis heyeri]|uniref:Uncharacterized protein n=1 Tax=Methylocystis heyeri TaxID=391905 RepID=A0A6B8KER5_9HYPH|nr:hypothetical protein [Methylocystis heyeri]QGM46119.1 hypothetical protein H2LOC_010670 [Methylocystis heyeri]